MNAKPLYGTFGCMVEAAPQRANGPEGDELFDLDANRVRSLFATHGLVLFRGFPTSIDAFRAFSDRLCDRFRSHSNVAQRIPLSEDGTVVTANQGLGEVLLHGEMYYLPEEQRPDVLWLYCHKPPATGAGGETTLADGVLLLQKLSPATRACFESKRIVYPRKKKAGANGDEATIGTVTYAVSRTRRGKQAFINSILNRYQHVGGRVEHPSMVHFEDGSLLPDEILRELLTTTELWQERLEWQAGDMVMLDNSWIMHGRRAFSGPRDVVTRMANLRTNERHYATRSV